VSTPPSEAQSHPSASADLLSLLYTPNHLSKCDTGYVVSRNRRTETLEETVDTPPNPHPSHLKTGLSLKDTVGDGNWKRENIELLERANWV
jgi:hypothetical protein